MWVVSVVFDSSVAYVAYVVYVVSGVCWFQIALFVVFVGPVVSGSCVSFSSYVSLVLFLVPIVLFLLSMSFTLNLGFIVFFLFPFFLPLHRSVFFYV